MKFQKMIPLFALAVYLIAGPVAASEDLAKKNGCMVCHGIDKKIVGPSYKDVAAKYKSDIGATAILAMHIRDGSKGAWGPVPMPPQAKISDNDLKAVVAWILKL